MSYKREIDSSQMVPFISWSGCNARCHKTCHRIWAVLLIYGIPDSIVKNVSTYICTWPKSASFSFNDFIIYDNWMWVYHLGSFLPQKSFIGIHIHTYLYVYVINFVIFEWVFFNIIDMSRRQLTFVIVYEFEILSETAYILQ
jgi:hypothetical protein